VRDGRGLQQLFVGESRREMRVHFGKDARQIPGGEIRAGFDRGLSARGPLP
jgi:hypothetical protein